MSTFTTIRDKIVNALKLRTIWALIGGVVGGTISFDGLIAALKALFGF